MPCERRWRSDAKIYSPDFDATDVFDADANGRGRDGMPNSGCAQVPLESVVTLSH